jgi:dTDP-4-amino-4,6-dideoxygalactose transaminase
VNNPAIMIPQSGRDSVWHIFPVLCERRDELQQYLLEHGVQTEIHYPIPPHKQKCYSKWNSLSFPVTERIHAQELSLPCNPSMTNEEANQVADLLNAF